MNRQSQRYLKINHIDPKSTQAKIKRSRLAKFPTLEEALSLWVSKAELHHQTLTGGIIRRKAFQFAERLNIDNQRDGSRTLRKDLTLKSIKDKEKLLALQLEVIGMN